MAEFNEDEIRAAQERVALKDLLKFKSTEARNTIFSLYDDCPDFSEQRSDLVAIIGMNRNIRSRTDLCKALEKAGCPFNSEEYNQTYDRYCELHPELTI